MFGLDPRVWVFRQKNIIYLPSSPNLLENENSSKKAFCLKSRLTLASDIGNTKDLLPITNEFKLVKKEKLWILIANIPPCHQAILSLPLQSENDLQVMQNPNLII